MATPPHFVAQSTAALTTQRRDAQPNAFATGKASSVSRSKRRGTGTYALVATTYPGRPSTSWLTINYRRASNNNRITTVLRTATQASSTMPSPNILRRTTQPTTTTLPMAPYTADNTLKRDLAHPDTARTNYTDVGRSWILLDVPGRKQEEARVIRRVTTPAHTKKGKSRGKG